jgi:hypothetical protein
VTQDDDGRRWSETFVKKVGAAVKTARGTKSAKWLSDRTAELGYRIPHTVISKLDSGHRGDVLSVPELFVLAAALDIPPALLLFPDYPDGTVELLPGFNAWVPAAVDWLSGNAPLPAEIRADSKVAERGASNAGVDLVGAVGRLASLDQLLLQSRFRGYPYDASPETVESTERAIRYYEQQLPLVKQEISQRKAALWGTKAEGEVDA